MSANTSKNHKSLVGCPRCRQAEADLNRVATLLAKAIVQATQDAINKQRTTDSILMGLNEAAKSILEEADNLEIHPSQAGLDATEEAKIQSA